MRLTLRTMLAYMDGILDAKDAEDLRQRIEDSEYANNLLHRTRDVMRKLRLTAPELGERIAGLDPNTVAEYLDNTLPSDGVTDFEKVCLDSDIHLAEVAACHQILTLVLGEPAEIDPDSRERMYALPQVDADRARQQSEQDTREAATGDGRANDKKMDDDAGEKKRHKPVVPDYLREPAKESKRRRLLPIAAMLLAAAGILALVLLTSGQFEPDSKFRQFLASRMGMGQTTEQAAEETRDEGSNRSADATKPDAEPTEKTDGTGGDLLDKSAELPADGTTPEDPVDKPSEDVSVIPPPNGHSVEPPLDPNDKTIVDPIDKTIVDPNDKSAVGPVEQPGEKPLVEPGKEPSGEPNGKPSDEMPPAPMPPQRLGRLMSADQVLLARDPQLDDWTRIQAKGSLDSGRRLLALPTYRAEVALSADITLQLLGPAQVQLLAPEGGLPIGLKIDYGRVVIMPIAQAGTRMRLLVGEREGTITFGNAESVVAVEVRPMPHAGSNPETEPVVILSTVYTTRGEAVWEETGEEQVVRLRAPARLDLDDEHTRTPRMTNDFPKWVVAEAISPLDSQASSTLAESLSSERSAVLGLMELAEHRRKEVRWLAVRCLARMGHFDSMVDALDDAEQRADWPDYIEQLRTIVNLGPEVAASLREALEKEHGKDAPALYRMLWGYTQEELTGGQAAKLVEYLEHSSLPMRVLSFWNLKEITGLGLFYRPTDLPTKRQLSVRRWRERLAAGEIP